ncbi:succinyl-CoA synthetase, beta subunit [Desulfosporosinus orientis DSM 765]|uniref:Succinyl-CoA synthetase, beta subunit n=1 Tax=Desulfosporosinus orientis (strain ATCC 19365 / DSM 765 / NCIMB 8382 / VKM B-1628 / Singapore I) TaxID=768706 RepID=G7WEZ0_DESOD|nr:ATP-grasp domain-containing protein [Desulfosporosinus orientis]AET67319.1 succinyl-CoA synthetase, beta subunit [Desulfosporosinus orientis DSM 765]
MGKLLEHHSKKIIADAGVLVPRNCVVRNPEEAAEKAQEIGCQVVLKALVPVGKRGKAGAIKFAANPVEAAARCQELLGMTVSHFPVEKVLVEEKLSIAQEWYLSITIDKKAQAPVVIASLEGGVDVEILSREHPEKVITHLIDPVLGMADFEAKEIWAELGLNGKALTLATQTLIRLVRVFLEKDASILEINPLVLTESGEVAAAASVMSIDDSAMYRHPELAGMVQLGSERTWRPQTVLEKLMVEVNEADPYRGTARYTEMDGGDIGFLCGGGGGSLLSFDALVSFGGRPANYSEVGGNPPERKVYGITKGILSKPGVKGLFVAHNITNNTQVDVMARGVVQALKDLGIDPNTFPVIVREAGVNDGAAKEIFTAAGIEYFGDEASITEAAGRMVERMKSLAAAEGGE